MSDEEREFSTVLFFEQHVGEGKPIAAVAWDSEDWAIVPAADAPSLAVSRIRGRLRRPIADAVKYLTDLGYTTPVTIVRAKDTAGAARIAIAALEPPSSE